MIMWKFKNGVFLLQKTCEISNNKIKANTSFCIPQLFLECQVTHQELTLETAVKKVIQVVYRRC